MRQRKFKFLLVSFLVFSGLLFAGGEARAVEFPNLGYQVTLAFSPSSDPTGNGSVYQYKFFATGTNTISNIDLAVPSDIVVPNNTKIEYSTSENGPWVLASWEYFAQCVGDSGSKFGVGDCRFSVIKINSTSRNFPLNFYIRYTVTGQVPGSYPGANGITIHKKLGVGSQEMQLKSGNGSVWESKAIDGPTIVPKVPTVTIGAAPNPIDYPEKCSTLTWTSTDASWVIISPAVGLVTPQGGGSTRVCPTEPTQYQIDAVGDGGSDTKYVTVSLGTLPPPPIPSIEISRETIEKRDNTGTIVGYVTTYYRNGGLACSYQTDINQTIPNYPCSDSSLCSAANPIETPRCDLAKTTNNYPLLTCIPFPGQDLTGICNNQVNCFVLNVTCKDSSNNPFTCPALCKPGEQITHFTTEQVGQNTCCLKKEPCATGGTGGYCYTKVPCAGTSTCP